MVLVDTPVWSLALRRQQTAVNLEQQRIVRSLKKLIEDGDAQIIGAIRQELLSGMKREVDFERLRSYLRAFNQPVLVVQDYEVAARMSNLCRARGIAGSGVDFLICSVAHNRRWRIFTADRDFPRYAKILPLRLYAGDKK